MNHPYFEYIKDIFGNEYDQYIDSLSSPLRKGLILNSTKKHANQLLNDLPFQLNDDSFAKDTYILQDNAIHYSDYALYHCGLWYSQEPSASSAVEVLDPKDGDIVLDACAAPGGKSCQIGIRIGKNGRLISNEFDSKRAQVLAENITRLGLDNTMVIQSDASKLSSALPCCFDKILVDAPCSGEGMIKKEEGVLSQWSIDYIQLCAKRQLSILDDVSKCLKVNGTLVYSTCTFNKVENEEVVAAFLGSHPDFVLEPIDVTWGRNGFALQTCPQTQDTRRIFPMDGGEGHFIAKFKRINGTDQKVPYIKQTNLSNVEIQYIKQAIGYIPSYYQKLNERLFISSAPLMDIKGLKVIKRYVELGEFATKRFEPNYEAARVDSLLTSIPSFETTIEEINKVIKGEPIEANIKGWVILTYKGLGYCFAKGDGHFLKNKYPKSKRIHYDVI